MYKIYLTDSLESLFHYILSRKFIEFSVSIFIIINNFFLSFLKSRIEFWPSDIIIWHIEKIRILLLLTRNLQELIVEFFLFLTIYT